MMEDLGSGFYLAMHDLEIRGAGEVLGEIAVGRDAGGRVPALHRHAALGGVGAEGGARARSHRAARRHDRDQPARAGAAARALLQRRARAARALQAPRELRDDGRARRDRRKSWSTASADCPSRRRRCSRATGCASSPSRSASRKVDAGPERTTIQFVKHPPFDAGALILLVQKDGRIRFAGPDRIRIERAAPTLSERVALVRDFPREAPLGRSTNCRARTARTWPHRPRRTRPRSTPPPPCVALLLLAVSRCAAFMRLSQRRYTGANSKPPIFAKSLGQAPSSPGSHA